MNSALTTTRIAEVYLLMIRYNAFHPRVIPGFEIRLALAGAREWPKAPSGPRAGAVQLPPAVSHPTRMGRGSSCVARSRRVG